MAPVKEGEIYCVSDLRKVLASFIKIKMVIYLNISVNMQLDSD